MTNEITSLQLIILVSKNKFLTYFDTEKLKLCLLAFTSTSKCLEYMHKSNLLEKKEINTIMAKISFVNLLILLKQTDLLKELDLLLIDRPFEGGICKTISLKQLNDMDFENIP